MTLLLQPVFVNNNKNSIRVERADGGTESDGGEPAFSPELVDEESLSSMWKVASKVKSVMVDGARFENLTWRAWYRKKQTGKDKIEMTLEMRVQEKVEEKTTDLAPSRATAIPTDKKGATNTKTCSGYSSILAEIQQACTHRRNSITKMFSFTPEHDANINVNSTMVGSDSGNSMVSESSVVTNPIRNSRRKKKDVDKFIRKHQVSNLERIAEQTESSTCCESDYTTDVGSSSTKASQTLHHHLDYSGTSTTDTISDNSLLDTCKSSCRKDKNIHKEHSQNNTSGALFRRGDQPAQIPTTTTDKPNNVSMLTMLLNRSSVVSNELKRSDSCPPPVMENTPPERPGAPLHDNLDNNSSSLKPVALDHALGGVLGSSGSPTTSASTPISTSGGRTHGSPTSTGSRRKPGPKPSEFVTPLYIW